MKAIQTEYKGYLFRSRLEARWAVFFDGCRIRWEYEPEGIVLSDGSFYLPDFYMPDFHCYFEVKRAGLEGTEEGKEAIRKISNGAWSDSWAGIICFGDPMDDNLILFCQETDDGGGGSYQGAITIGIHPYKQVPYLFAYNDGRERSFLTSFCEDPEYIPAVTSKYGYYEYDDFVNARVLAARKAARQVRFEHGEAPVIRRRRI